jgi:hypothetical protein
MRREFRGLGGQTHCDDQFARFQHAFTTRRVAGETVEGFKRNFATPALARYLHHCIERYQRDAEIRRVGRDATLAPAEHRVQPRIATARLAAGAWLALIAGTGDVVEVSAPRALQQIAADSRCIAQLCRRAGQQRFRHRGKASGKRSVMRQVGIAHTRADPHAAIGQRLDHIEAR